MENQIVLPLEFNDVKRQRDESEDENYNPTKRLQQENMFGAPAHIQPKQEYNQHQDWQRWLLTPPPQPNQSFREITQMLENKVNEGLTMRTATTPMLSQSRFNLLMSRFRHIPIKEKERKETDCATFWKTDRRLVNQGTCFYCSENDTYYVKSKFTKYSDPNRCPEMKDEMNPRDISWLEVERSEGIRLDKRYNKIKFYVLPPEEDTLKVKITPCDNHRKEHGSDIFFRIEAAKDAFTRTILKQEDADIYQFDISGNEERFVPFRAQFFCWSHCCRVQFSHKKQNIQFITVIYGDGVDDIKIKNNINVQSNPGRGAGVVRPGIKWTSQNTNRPRSAGQMQGHGPDTMTSLYPNAIHFSSTNHKVKIELEIPSNFRMVLGDDQADAEIRAIRRDVDFLINNRLRDAMQKKALANDDLNRRYIFAQKEISVLRNINRQLHEASVGADKSSEDILAENRSLIDKLVMERTARDNCSECVRTRNERGQGPSGLNNPVEGVNEVDETDIVIVD